MQGKKFLLSYSFSHKKGFCFFILSSLLFNMIRGASTGNCNGENCVISPTSTTYNYQQDALSSFQAFTNAKVTPYKDKSLKVGELRYGEDNNILWQIFEEEKLSRIVELATVDVTTTVKMKCEKVLKHAGWYHDDLDKKSYEINKVFAKRGEEEREFLGIFEQSDLGLPYKIDRTFFKNEGDIILENGIPKKITGTVYTVYSRKDDTEYEVKDISRDHPLEIKHVSFSHNREANKSYQIVKLSIIHQNTPYIIEKGYKISGIPYPHQYSLVKWEDDMNGHISTKFEKVFINTNQPKALDEGNIPEQDRIVDNIIKTQTQEHQKLWNIPGSWILPGNNYRIPHSGLEYR